jgi:hypothetical protein
MTVTFYEPTIAPPENKRAALVDVHDDGSRVFRKAVGMRTMIIFVTVAFGAMRLMLNTLSTVQRPGIDGEWTADE